jgi:hypothetical protein
VAFDSQDPNVVVAGGRDSGVFLSIDGGGNWLLLTDPIDSANSGTPHLPRPWFAYFDREPTDMAGELNFFIGTQGRGVWRVSVTNLRPVCDANGPYVAECAGPTTPVTLDGRGSSDPDGDPLDFAWTGPFVGGTATGPMPTVDFAGTGMFSVDLEVSDSLARDFCAAEVSVVDTTPPVVSCAVATAMLWPPNHDLENVGLVTSAVDVCSGTLPVTTTVFGDEDDEEVSGDGNHSPDAKQDPALRLRSERQGNSDGRVYLILSTAMDSSGNVGHDCCSVVVPHSRSSADMASVEAQAAAAKAFCEANAAAPVDYFVVGDGPVIGPKQ